MPRSQSRHRKVRAPVRDIDGQHTTSIDNWTDPASRGFVVVKFSMIKTLRDDESGFNIQGNAINLGYDRGSLRTIECPKGSGHHVLYAALPKNCEVRYRWLLMGEDRRYVKERELHRTITLGENDITVQDVFGDYTSLLPQIFQPECSAEDQMLMPVAFITNHQVANNAVEAVAIVGSTPELGRWRAVNARMMYEVKPGVWETILYLSKTLKFKYKFVVIDKNRRKKIKYGERQEHRVNLNTISSKDGNFKSTPKIVESETDNPATWTTAGTTDVAIEHVEEQSMGSVTSEISLGSRPSLGSCLSDIIEMANNGSLDDVDINQAEEINVAEEQKNILEELKEELYGSTDLIDFHTTVDESALLITQNAVEEEITSNIAEASTQLPQATQDVHTMCAEWLANSNASDTDVALRCCEESLKKIEQEPSKDCNAHQIEVVEEIELLAVGSSCVKEPLEPVPTIFKFEKAEVTETKVLGSSHCLPTAEASCTSLKTPTSQLPCYCTGTQSTPEVARKIARKLPWILDLPSGLTSRVLHSLGILSKDKQTAVAKELKKPKEKLLKEEEKSLFTGGKANSHTNSSSFEERRDMVSKIQPQGQQKR